MKLKPFDQAVVVILMIALIACAVGTIALCWNNNLIWFVGTVCSVITANIINRALVSIGAVLLIFLCGRVLFIRTHKEAQAPKITAQTGILVRAGEDGNSFITLDALNTMIQKHIRANSKIRDCKAHISPDDDKKNVSIELQVVLLPDVNIPEVTADLQKSLKDYIQNMTGISVDGVQVTVGIESASSANQPKARSIV